MAPINVHNGKVSLVTLLVCFALSASAQLEKGLVARYSFNKGNPRDEVGSNHARVYGAMLTEDRFGNSNYAYFLQGNSDSYINLGTNNTIKPKHGSVSLWVKIDLPIEKGSGVLYNPIFFTRSHKVDDFNEALLVGYDFSTRKINVNASLSNLNQVNLYPTNTTYLRRWYHVAITYDDNIFCLYIDGVLIGKAAKNFESRFLEGDSVLLGNRHGTKNNRYLQGIVDDIAIYNRVLSPDEVLQLYNAPNPNKSAIVAKWVMISTAALAFLGLIVWLVRWRIRYVIRKEKLKNELLSRSYEQEIKVLKAQMNPHFIFNSLNTIQQFIIVNQNEKAQLYLSKFSRLIRKLLESNSSDSISFEDEIKILTGYIEIESMRFNNIFEYKIIVDNKLKGQEISIPHFLIQPFVENAIWHGLLPKKSGGKALTIAFELQNEKLLRCVIGDNGIGRKNGKKEIFLEKNKSLAIDYIKLRLELMSKIKNTKYGIHITDKVNDKGLSEGTEVEINIPILKYAQSNNN